jgi:hypothetical protein
MKIARFFPAFAACFLSTSILTPALAQNAIASISKSALELYDAPDLTAFLPNPSRQPRYRLGAAQPDYCRSRE